MILAVKAIVVKTRCRFVGLYSLSALENVMACFIICVCFVILDRPIIS